MEISNVIHHKHYRNAAYVQTSRKKLKRLFFHIATVGLLLIAGFTHAQNRFPDRPININVPYAPGGWSDRFTFSPGVRVGNLLYISGMTLADEKGNLVGAGDIVRQTEYIFELTGRILAAAGADFSKAVAVLGEVRV